MAYKIQGAKLRASQQLAAEHHTILKKGRLVLLQHLLEDTFEFSNHLLQNGATIDKIFGKQYSVDPAVMTKFRAEGIEPIKITYKDVEKDDSILLEAVTSALQMAKEHHQKVIIHEVGGYFCQTISKIPPELKPYLAGVVEDTSYGYNRYLAIQDKLEYPVFHVARSQLKEVESMFVGSSIVTAFESLMREVGISITGREALVVGYGMIGKNIAKALRRHQVHTTIYDLDASRLLQGYIRGHHTLLEKGNFAKYDAVFSATGSNAVSLDDIKQMKDGVVLISGGSKDIEFDVAGLRKHAETEEEIYEDITLYTLNGKKVYVLRQGTALNFRQQSVPNEIIDLVYAEILSCIVELLANKKHYAPGLHQLPPAQISIIARKWLESISQEDDS